MRLLEYQAKQLLAEEQIPIPAGSVAATPDQARSAAAGLGGPVVVKAQVRVGGRGKAGGIRRAETPAQAADHAAAMLGSDLRGETVREVLVEQALDIQAEYYLGIALDRSARASAAMVSALGGVDIEEVAAEQPERVIRRRLDPALGLPAYLAREMAYQAGLAPAAAPAAARLLESLHRAYLRHDATLIEINPLALCDGSLVAADAKAELDESARPRHPEWPPEPVEDPVERRARELGLQYVRLDGRVGVIGNGAGLVMATLDEVSRAGGKAANFLDIGGGARAEVVREALSVVLGDPRVRSVLINIFGGITRCDEVARGILEVPASGAPLVVRMTGTNKKEGRALLEQGGIPFSPTMEQAARRAVELAGKGEDERRGSGV